MSETAHEEAYADGTPLVELFGDGARARMLSVFVDERTRDLSVSEIARQAGVARSTVYDHLDDFVELGVVEFTRETGPSKRYQFNADSEIADFLYKLDGTVLSKLLENRDDVDYDGTD
ncbi:IclR helix-turn-helix domain-containing protein [Halomicrobium zhouii]|uniref:IclR helix-turn-helix domain-containing protein n=1 Tax=Halomicrobium zhouii TaxID=767519 RepID=A0A1I6M7Z8_9EURY|nr:winged helix-turn-helix domain-containing protein [Halomicrobium zhouii]SFS11824.1 IclR helix-turn-helix domain-containing protein [Halomicrobium zhouii]